MSSSNLNINSDESREITKQSKSSFLYSFSLLSGEKNDAINTVYAYCRMTDDIVDNQGKTPEEKFEDLKEWRNELSKALSGEVVKFSLLNKLNLVIKKFNIPELPFFELIDGMEMDLIKNRYSTFAELREYCYKVASTVGLMSIEIFGYKNPETRNFAVNLGIALQLTNILRDIRTDADNGRIYIPMEDLRRFNYSESDLLEGKYNSEFVKLMEFECNRAKEYYQEADRELAREDKGNMFAARIMEYVYFRLLRKIEKKNYNVFEKKLSVSKLKKIIITAGVYLKYRMIYGFHEERAAISEK
ncbi:MAG TPA: presqualene diphosphate synthase HpnD [Ignavibacteria bacterium]|nr:presqualene diphosphate synthase HpnD [Ignavibacteria bacterium]HMR41830.1 presqualene diphosphate synthase HpnD [Ignavibacteria bacterium]